MFLPTSDIQDHIGTAYIQAIVANSGYIFSDRRQDYGIDGSIHSVQLNREGKPREATHRIDFQLKSIYDYKEKDGYVEYKLPIKNYNQLIETDIGTPKVLLLYLMPRRKCEWLQIQEETSRLKHYAIWGNLGGLPYSKNKYIKTIKIPKADIFNSQAIVNMLTKIEKGESIERRVIV